MHTTLSRPASSKKFILTTGYQAFAARKWMRTRLLGVACYFGFAPFLGLAGVDKHGSSFLRHHYRHGLAVSLLMFFILATTAVTDALGYVYATRIWNPTPEEVDTLVWLVEIFNWTGNLICLVWAGAGVYGAVSAWRGGMARIPLLTNLAANKGWMNFSLGWSIIVRVGLIALVLVAAHGSVLTAHPSASPQVYILYTTGGYIPTEELWANYTPPHWTFDLFFYPIVTAGIARWGKGSVIIEPLSDATFKQAIRNGRFVFVASHGGMEPGSFSYQFNPYGGMLPSDLQPGDAGAQLHYVYFAACYAGDLESQWRQALAPAEVRTYARISYVEEHFFWVWTQGAKVIAKME